MAEHEALDKALAEGRLSRMGYLLERMRLAEQDAERIIAATPQAQADRLALAYDQRADSRPKTPKRYHD